jgi:hypothetical protein
MEGSFVCSRVWLSKGNKFQMGKMANYGNTNPKRSFSEIALKNQNNPKMSRFKKIGK